ncbi:hypothetical protein Daus18300_010412 [Diaporthe australafricana]|uniref:Uncharacterized protein n=1 Tax=Diaporthe australafricana TaxID=127596 RepID=A0ABR3WB40_9PEZI
MEPERGLDIELQTLSRICFPPWRTRVRTRIMRPERPEYSMLMGSEGDHATEKRANVLRILHTSFRGGPKGRSFVSIAQKKRIIIAVTAILFDQEVSGNIDRQNGFTQGEVSNPRSSIIKTPLSLFLHTSKSGPGMMASLIEHMLLVDYGLGEHPLRTLDSEFRCVPNHRPRVFCEHFCHNLTKMADDCRDGKDIGHTRMALMDECIQGYKDDSSANDDFSDVSLMLYYFNTRRRNISNDDFNNGRTGYTGVLDEMISEIPVIGTDRLTRKLSVDVNKLIPQYVRAEESRTKMIALAERTAVEYGILIQAPVFAFERLMMPSIHDSGSLRLLSRISDSSIRGRNMTRSEREPSPPPSYEEAMRGST